MNEGRTANVRGPLLQSPVSALGSLPNVALPSEQVQQITTYPLNGKTNYLKRGGQKGMVYSKKPQGEVGIGAAPFRCGLIGYNLKLDSFLS
jgi:hypothetical protein